MKTVWQCQPCCPYVNNHFNQIQFYVKENKSVPFPQESVADAWLPYRRFLQSPLRSTQHTGVTILWDSSSEASLSFANVLVCDLFSPSNKFVGRVPYSLTDTLSPLFAASHRIKFSQQVWNWGTSYIPPVKIKMSFNKS